MDMQSLVQPNEYADMERLCAINEEIKKLDAEKKQLSESIKKIMVRLNIDHGDVGSASLSIVHSTRKTLPKAVHDKFVAELVGLGKQNLIKTSIEPDLDAVMDEVDAGTLDKDMVRQYVNVTDITTLRCNL